MSDAFTSFVISVVLMGALVIGTALTVRKYRENVTIVRHLSDRERVVRIESHNGDVRYASETWGCNERRCRYWRTGVYYTEAAALESKR